MKTSAEKNTQEPQKAILVGSTGGDETFIGKCDYHGEYEGKKLQVYGNKVIRTHCPRCKQEEKAKEEKRQQEINERDWEMHVDRERRSACIPKRFKGRTLDNYTPDSDGQVYAHKVATAYAAKFEDRMRHGGGLVLCGKPGTGKTHLAAGIANHVLTTGRSALFLTVIKAIRSVKETYSRASERTEQQAINDLQSPDLLILDEVGVQFGTDAEKLILFEILNGRYENMRPTIIISNLMQEELAGYLGERVVDRLQEGGGAVVPFTWESYRMQVAKNTALPTEDAAPVRVRPTHDGFK